MKIQDTELTPERIAELEALAEMPDDEIDTSDIPEAVDPPSARRGIFALPPDRRRKAILELKRSRPGGSDTSERGVERPSSCASAKSPPTLTPPQTAPAAT